MMAVPPAILDLLRLDVGATVELTMVGGRLVVEPKPKQSYLLEELLAQCDGKQTEAGSVEEREWLEAPAQGREL